MGVTGWLRAPGTLRSLALASVIANCVLIITGGAVRLTASGLGCPTWPKCTDSSLVPTSGLSLHSAIEFGNRSLSAVLGIIAAATLLAAIVARREVALAALAFLIIPVQAVIGGITVRTDLNPWVVSLHFLASVPAVAVALLLWWRVSGQRRVAAPASLRAYVWGLTAVAVAVLAVGTIVTGAGPHAGDKRADGTVNRNGLAPGSMSQLHTDIVMVLVGLTVGLLVATYLVAALQPLRRTAWALVAAELLQAVIGFVQYFTHLPVLLVWFHMIGTCLVWLATLAVLYRATVGETLTAAD